MPRLPPRPATLCPRLPTYAEWAFRLERTRSSQRIPAPTNAEERQGHSEKGPNSTIHTDNRKARDGVEKGSRLKRTCGLSPIHAYDSSVRETVMKSEPKKTERTPAIRKSRVASGDAFADSTVGKSLQTMSPSAEDRLATLVSHHLVAPPSSTVTPGKNFRLEGLGVSCVWMKKRESVARYARIFRAPNRGKADMAPSSPSRHAATGSLCRRCTRVGNESSFARCVCRVHRARYELGTA